MATPILVFDDVSKVYARDGASTLHALHNVSVTVPAGATVSITGRSGSGKSTFLHLAAGIDRPTTGRITARGRDLSLLSDRDLTLHRRDTVGLVFQFFYLLPHLTVKENVLLPAMIAGDVSAGMAARAVDLLSRVGLADRAGSPVQKLSGGEMQRVAICRALLRRAPLLLADEPTGNLDDESSRTVMDLLLRLSREEGSTLIYVTHSLELAALAELSWRIHSGILETA